MEDPASDPLGQVIATVGESGKTSGPHLHFEFKINGKQVDPLTIARASETTQVTPTAMNQFRQLAGTMTARLNTASELRTAGAQSSARRSIGSAARGLLPGV